jgi:hypothetical protein
MMAMQYEIGLPADYAMSIIDRRVRERGSAFDALPGLALKAFLVRERGQLGSPVNQYAPFYLWHSPDAMARFLAGPSAFDGLIDSFERPAVRTWVTTDFLIGKGASGAPAYATRSMSIIPTDASAADFAGRAAGRASQSDSHQLHSTAVLLCPSRWELAVFTLWNSQPEVPDAVMYKVLRLSSPGIAPAGGTPAFATEP